MTAIQTISSMPVAIVIVAAAVTVSFQQTRVGRPVPSGGAGDVEVVEFTEDEIAVIVQHRLPPLPGDPTNRYADDPAAAHFGQYLFFDPRLSENGAVSCATCHDPAKGFTDGKRVADAIGTLRRNTMSLWNVGYERWFFWDGRADTLWAQALIPIEHPDEMGGDRMAIAHLIAGDPHLRHAYEQTFGSMPQLTDESRFPKHARPVSSGSAHPHQRAWDEMTPVDRDSVNRVFVNVGKAIAAYERRLVSRDSPFDRFVEGLVAGDRAAQDALSSAAKRGLKMFVGDANCRLCHSGPTFSDHGFHNNGLPGLAGGMPTDPGRFDALRSIVVGEFSSNGPYSDAREGETADRLRYLTRTPELWGAFKTPTLRNVARTGPYMHAGQMSSLREVVEFYSTLEGQVRVGHHQEVILQPLRLTEQEADDLLAFLEALTGRLSDEALVRQPAGPCLPDR